MFINGTPHEITLYFESDCTFDSSTRKLVLNENAIPLFKIPAGKALNAKTQVRELDNSEFPFLKGAVEFVEADSLPGEDEIVIVSNLYRSALKDLGISTQRLATVGGTVYASVDNPRPVGCTYLSVG